MAHKAQQDFCQRIQQKLPHKFKGVSVIDIGSLDINGNNRFLFEDYTYTGLDLGEGLNVDVVCPGHEHSSSVPYDVAISTECLEHDEHWRRTLQNMYALTKPGGIVLITCASTKRGEHGTRKTSPANAPFIQDYYGNLTEKDFREVLDIEKGFSEWEFQSGRSAQDLYFYGVKKLDDSEQSEQITE